VESERGLESRTQTSPGGTMTRMAKRIRDKVKRGCLLVCADASEHRSVG